MRSADARAFAVASREETEAAYSFQMLAMKILEKLALVSACGYASLHLARTIVRQRRSFAWKGKRVVITGGSRGLGLVIARQLADQGARLAICSRTMGPLNIAAEELRARGVEVFSQACDVRDIAPSQSFHRPSCS